MLQKVSNCHVQFGEMLQCLYIAAVWQPIAVMSALRNVTPTPRVLRMGFVLTACTLLARSSRSQESLLL